MSRAQRLWTPVRDDPGGASFLALLTVLAVAVPALNLVVPGSWSLHLSTYALTLIGKYLCYAMLAVAVDLIWGYCGILSLGHAAFFSLGGYAMGMYLMRQIGPRGVYGDPILPAYATTKSGLLGLTRVIAVDYAEAGIRCNCVCPGDMDTPMLRRSFARAEDGVAMRREMEAAYPLKRIADPREVARVIVFVLSDSASFTTGAVIPVDGGLTAKCY